MRCIVKHCFVNANSGESESPDKITYHRFPTNIATRGKWIQIIRESRREPHWIPTTYCVICSEHFKEDMRYLTKTGKQRLRKTAVPTENLFDGRQDLPPVEYEEEIPNYLDTNTCTDIVPFNPLSQQKAALPALEWELEVPINCEDLVTPQLEVEPLFISPPIPNWELELPTRPKSLIAQPNYLLISPPSQDPDIQYLEIRLKRERLKIAEFKMVWMRKLKVLQQKMRRLRANNAFLKFKLWQVNQTM